MLTPTPRWKLSVSLIVCLSLYECVMCAYIYVYVYLSLSFLCTLPSLPLSKGWLRPRIFYFSPSNIFLDIFHHEIHFSELSSSPSTKTEEKSKCSLVAHSRMYIIFNNTLYVYVCTVDGRVPKTAYLLLPETPRQSGLIQNGVFALPDPYPSR